MPYLLVYCLWQNQSLFFFYTAAISSMMQHCSESLDLVISLVIFDRDIVFLIFKVCDKIQHCPNGEDDLGKLC